jgi:hypothetical protein
MARRHSQESRSWFWVGLEFVTIFISLKPSVLWLKVASSLAKIEFFILSVTTDKFRSAPGVSLYCPSYLLYAFYHYTYVHISSFQYKCIAWMFLWIYGRSGSWYPFEVTWTLDKDNFGICEYCPFKGHGLHAQIFHDDGGIMYLWIVGNIAHNYSV